MWTSFPVLGRFPRLTPIMQNIAEKENFSGDEKILYGPQKY
jgi:hypothetical protein